MTPDPVSIIVGILRTPQGREAAANIAGTVARPAKGFAAMTGMADPSVAPWLQPSIIPEKYNHPYGTTPAEIERAQQARMGEDLLGGVGNIARVGPKIAQALRAAPAEKAGIRAYHGSPYDFDKFSMSKIGTGEGAQSYGYGLYFAEAEPVAKAYREQLGHQSLGRGAEGNDTIRRMSGSLNLDRKQAGQVFTSIYDDAPAAVIAKRMQMANTALRDDGASFSSGAPLGPKGQQLADLIDQVRTAAKGRMYEVNIRANPNEFLDWDKPLSQQARNVQDLAGPRIEQIKKAAPDYVPKDPSGDWIYKAMQPQGRVDNFDFAKPLPLVASSALRDAGIPGIRYLDQGSRPGPGDAGRMAEGMIGKYGSREAALEIAQQRLKAASMGDIGYWQKIADELAKPQTNNYVLFRDDIVDILRKYGIPAGGVAGAGALGSAAVPGQADAASLTPTGIARALREGK